MTTILIAVIFTAFVGLGIPDSLVGSAWPAIYQELGISSSLNFCMTIPVSLCTIAASLLSGKLIEKFGTGLVSTISTLLTAGAIFLISISDNFIAMVLCGIPLGFGAGAIDSGLNGFVARNYSARVMNFLHASYGVGVAVSPYLIALAIEKYNWRTGYRIVFFIQLAITIIIALSIPLWKKAEKKDVEKVTESRKISTGELLKTKGLSPILLTFFFSCATEFLFGSWMTTFLVTQKETLKETAAKILTTYYVGLTSGRLISGVFSDKLKAKNVIAIAYCIQIFAALTLFIPYNNNIFYVVTAFLLGFGVGPVFHNLTHLTPSNFGYEKSQRIMGLQYAASSGGVMAIPFTYGLLSSVFTHKIFPFVLIAAISAAVVFAIISKKIIEKAKA